MIFKIYCLTVMTLIAATYTVALRYTRTVSSDLYFSTTAVCLAEVIKLLLSLLMLVRCVLTSDTDRCLLCLMSDLICCLTQGDRRPGPLLDRSGHSHFQKSQGAAKAERAVGGVRHPEQHGLRGFEQPGRCCLPGIMNIRTDSVIMYLLSYYFNNYSLSVSLT